MKAGTDLGKLAKEYMDKGGLVPGTNFSKVLFIVTLHVSKELIVGNPPTGGGFFHTGVRRRKYKLSQTKQNSFGQTKFV